MPVLANSLDTLWSLLGWSLASIAALTLLLTLLGDAPRRRFRRMRRCPKCWYDLSHTPGMKCSECGYTAKRERQLFRTRRRKRWVLVALLVWIGSYFAFRVPAMQQRGWVAAVPTTVLVCAAPHVAANRPGEYQAQRESLISEVAYRAQGDSLADWQWGILIRGALRDGRRPFMRTLVPGEAWDMTSLSLLKLADRQGRLVTPQHRRRAHALTGVRIVTRSRWPAGSPVFARVTPVQGFGHSIASMKLLTADPSLGEVPFRAESIDGIELDRRPTYWSDDLSLIARSAEEGRIPRLRFSAERPVDGFWSDSAPSSRLSWQHDINVRTAIGGKVDDILTPVQSPEFERRLTDTEGFLILGDHLWVSRLERSLRLLDGATFAASFEVRDGDFVIATARAWWALDADSTLAPSPRDVLLEFTDDAPEPPGLLALEGLRLRIRSDPEMALRRFDCDRYWAGEVIVPVKWLAPPHE